MNSLHTPTRFLDHLITELHLASASTISHFLTPQKTKGFVLVFSCLDPSTAGDTADPLFSLGTPPSPSITSLPFGFLPIFLIIIPQSSSWPTQPLPVLPGGVCPDSAHCLAVVLSLFTSLEQSHLPRTGYIICEA